MILTMNGRIAYRKSNCGEAYAAQQGAAQAISRRERGCAENSAKRYIRDNKGCAPDCKNSFRNYRTPKIKSPHTIKRTPPSKRLHA